MSDLDRFEDLFVRNWRPLLAYAARRLGSLPDVEDAVAETFAMAWRRFDSVPAGPDATPWLYGACRKVLSNRYRATNRRERLLARLRTLRPSPQPVLTLGEPGPAAIALASLSEDDQELLRLVAWEELRPAQIAELLGITANAVSIRLYRARKRFASALAHHSDAERSSAMPDIREEQDKQAQR